MTFYILNIATTLLYYIILYYILYVILDHKTSKLFEIEIYTSSESWINKLSIDVWFCLAGIQLFENLESEGAKKKI